VPPPSKTAQETTCRCRSPISRVLGTASTAGDLRRRTLDRPHFTELWGC
jgi:hypothetical protein